MNLRNLKDILCGIKYGVPLSFFVPLILLAVGIWHVRPSFQQDPNPILVVIPPGYSVRKIAQVLCERKVLRSPLFFEILVYAAGNSGSLKHGAYLLDRNRYGDALRKLRSGLSHRTKVTIPEGWTSFQIAQKLEAEGLLSDTTSFVLTVQKNGLEGMLFPETYFLEPGTKPESWIRQMAREYRARFSEEFSLRTRELGWTEIQVLTLASIIEREAQVDQEREIISSVYHNRLKKKFPLQADPTVQYSLSGGRFWKEKLNYKDLEIASPFNTYRNLGLPPAPICNPGLKAIRAALYPARTEYLYFVADGKGGHNFFKDYRSHMQIQLKNKKVAP